MMIVAPCKPPGPSTLTAEDSIWHQYSQQPCRRCGRTHYRQQTTINGTLCSAPLMFDPTMVCKQLPPPTCPVELQQPIQVSVRCENDNCFYKKEKKPIPACQVSEASIKKPSQPVSERKSESVKESFNTGRRNGLQTVRSQVPRAEESSHSCYSTSNCKKPTETEEQPLRSACRCRNRQYLETATSTECGLMKNSEMMAVKDMLDKDVQICCNTKEYNPQTSETRMITASYLSRFAKSCMRNNQKPCHEEPVCTVCFVKPSQTSCAKQPSGYLPQDSILKPLAEVPSCDTLLRQVLYDTRGPPRKQLSGCTEIPSQKPSGCMDVPVQKKPSCCMNVPAQKEPSCCMNVPVQKQPSCCMEVPSQKQPRAYLTVPSQKPSPCIQEPSQKLSACTQEPSRKPSPCVQEPSQKPSPCVQEPSQKPSACVQAPSQRPSACVQAASQKPSTCKQAPFQKPSACVQEPSQRPSVCKQPPPGSIRPACEIGVTPSTPPGTCRSRPTCEPAAQVPCRISAVKQPSQAVQAPSRCTVPQSPCQRMEQQIITEEPSPCPALSTCRELVLSPTSQRSETDSRGFVPKDELTLLRSRKSSKTSGEPVVEPIFSKQQAPSRLSGYRPPSPRLVDNTTSHDVKTAIAANGSEELSRDSSEKMRKVTTYDESVQLSRSYAAPVNTPTRQVSFVAGQEEIIIDELESVNTQECTDPPTKQEEAKVSSVEQLMGPEKELYKFNEELCAKCCQEKKQKNKRCWNIFKKRKK